MARPRRRRVERPHIALIVETSLASGREILRGVARYVREHGHWSTFYEPRSLEESAPGWLRRWDGDGIIARLQNEAIAESVLQAKVPVVDVLGVVRHRHVPLVHTDDAAVAALAADHLLDRGFRRFAFFGLAGENWSNARREAFTKKVGDAGCPCDVYETPREVHHTKNWEDYADDLARWIRGLAKPVGLMVCSDQCGPVVMEACRRGGAGVPDEVAVIGVDNDEPLCEVADPNMSSVWPDHFRVGYEAAALLDRLMNRERKPTAPIYLPPRGVVTRRSTEVLAIDDPDIASAVRFIRQNACDGVTIDRVAASVSLSRSVLQRRFKAIVGRTLHEEILRVRLNRAKELLTESDVPIGAVAERAGFKHQEYLGVVFRQHVGQTPARFRRDHLRLGASAPLTLGRSQSSTLNPSAPGASVIR